MAFAIKRLTTSSGYQAITFLLHWLARSSFGDCFRVGSNRQRFSTVIPTDERCDLLNVPFDPDVPLETSHKLRRHSEQYPYVRVGERGVAATYQDDCGENARVLGDAQRMRDIRADAVRLCAMKIGAQFARQRRRRFTIVRATTRTALPEVQCI